MDLDRVLLVNDNTTKVVGIYYPHQHLLNIALSRVIPRGSSLTVTKPSIPDEVSMRKEYITDCTSPHDTKAGANALRLGLALSLL